MKRVLIGIGATCGAAAAVLACSSSSPASPNNEVPDSGVPTPDATSPVVDAGGVACGTGSTLYERLGGYDGIHAALVQVVAAELGNADIASYFFNQVSNPVPAGHPTADQITDCLAVQLSAAAGGPYSYPPDGGVTTDGGTFICRDMATIHQPLLISGGSFDEFVSIAASTLSPEVCATDLAMVGSVLTSTKPVIVYAPLADAGLEPFPGDAGVSK